MNPNSGNPGSPLPGANCGKQTSGVLLIGCGNMGYALLDGWAKSGAGFRIHVVEPEASLRQRAVERGANASADAAGIAPSFTPAFIVVAVKPQFVTEVLKTYRAYIDSGALVLSVAAGVTVAATLAEIGENAAVVRCMPNTPASVGAGALVCYANRNVSEGQRQTVKKLLAYSGSVYFVANEAMMDAVTAVSGSGPAYVFHFIECLAQAGIQAGLEPELSWALAGQTVYGAALLAKTSSESAGTLRKQVTSPNGTTASALSVLMGSESSLQKIVTASVEAAKQRSIELGRQ